MLEKVKPVLDTSYKPYISDGNQEDNNKYEFYYDLIVVPLISPGASEAHKPRLHQCNCAG
ncbi:hypothetical protein DSO57_1013929 [Entomophthora muscae]|uniref:Uncharacterized protein n=1 Tax=Entomophthora muscae TaxID=34485 RepID=A0ACC2UQD3_9FUNG|nr:hypothetical protein DSO57_1013929 [Entomophthora muscae]